MVTREITVSELMFLRDVIQALEEQDTDCQVVETDEALEIIDALINYKGEPNE